MSPNSSTSATGKTVFILFIFTEFLHVHVVTVYSGHPQHQDHGASDKRNSTGQFESLPDNPLAAEYPPESHLIPESKLLSGRNSTTQPSNSANQMSTARFPSHQNSTGQPHNQNSTRQVLNG